MGDFVQMACSFNCRVSSNKLVPAEEHRIPYPLRHVCSATNRLKCTRGWQARIAIPGIPLAFSTPHVAQEGNMRDVRKSAPPHPFAIEVPDQAPNLASRPAWAMAIGMISLARK